LNDEIFPYQCLETLAALVARFLSMSKVLAQLVNSLTKASTSL
jgi:hypothetical protein